MKPFRFNLEAVSTIRKRAEREALENYAEALCRRRGILEELHAIEQDLEAGWSRMRKEVVAGCRASKMAQMRRHNQALQAKRAQCETALTESERAVSQTLQRMLVARMQREAVEGCRSQQRARHERDLNRETQKFLDELNFRRAMPALAWRKNTDPFA